MASKDPITCDSRIATVCSHNPKTEEFQLFGGVVLVERAMCNGARDISVKDSDRALTNAEWQEYWDRSIARRIVKKSCGSPSEVSA